MSKKGDITSAIIAFETGELDQKQTIKLFQDLIDTGLAWKLQGIYGRTAETFIESGWCHEGTKKR